MGGQQSTGASIFVVQPTEARVVRGPGGTACRCADHLKPKRAVLTGAVAAADPQEPPWSGYAVSASHHRPIRGGDRRCAFPDEAVRAPLIGWRPVAV